MTTIRQSHLRFLLDKCPAGAYALAVEGRDGPHGSGALRGTAVHEFFARYNAALAATRRETDFEAVPDIARAVLTHYPQLSVVEAADVLDQARRIGEQYVFDAAHYYGSEVPLATVIGPATVTGHLDVLYLDGEQATVRDLKTNHRLPPDSEVKQDTQLRIYAALVFANFAEVQEVRGELWFTRYGRLLPQSSPAVWTREDNESFVAYLAMRLNAFLAGELRSDYVPGTHCQYCPRRRVGDCTLWRSYYGTTPPPPLSATQAQRLARRVIALEQAREQAMELLKRYCNEQGELPVGSGSKAERFAFHVIESQEWDPGEVWRLLEEERSLVGEPTTHLSVFRVDAHSRAFRELSRVLGPRLADLARPKLRTVFGHKGVSDDDD